MARIRTLKPEFWEDEKLSLLDPLTRLVFLGLISQADDAGRLVDNVKTLDGLLFPNTDDTCRDALEALARMSRITRYRSASGQQLIQLVGWDKHQKVDRPSRHVLPGPETAVVVQPPVASTDTPALDESSRDTRDTLAKDSRSDLGPRTVDHGPRTAERGSGTEDRASDDQPLAPPADARASSEPPAPPDTPPDDLRAWSAGLPRPVLTWLRRFYPTGATDPKRQLDVLRQLWLALHGGARISRGESAHAGSVTRLAQKCTTMLAEAPPDNADRAIVILLRKLADTTDLAIVREQRAAEEKRDEQLAPIDLEHAERWLAGEPHVADAIAHELAVLGHTDPEDPLTRTVRRTMVLRAYRQATTDPAAQHATPTNPNAGAAA